MQCAQHSILFFQSGSKIKVPGPRHGTLILGLCQRPDHWVLLMIRGAARWRTADEMLERHTAPQVLGHARRITVDKWPTRHTVLEGWQAAPGITAEGVREQCDDPCCIPRGEASRTDARTRIGHFKACMTDIYLHFIFAHYGLYGNAPVSGSYLYTAVSDTIYTSRP